MKTYVQAKHFDYIIRPQGLPITIGYPDIEPDYSGGPHDTLSIISAIFELADYRTGIIAPNVSTRLFLYKDLFELYKPFADMCSNSKHAGRSNSHVVAALKTLGYTKFTTDDPDIPDCWIKAGEALRFNKHPDMAKPILERIANKPNLTISERISGSTTEGALAAKEETFTIGIQHAISNLQNYRNLRSEAKRLYNIASMIEHTNIVKQMSEHINT